MSMRVRVWVVLLGCIFPCAYAQGQLIRVNSAYTGESPTQLVAFLAKETGIFAKNGLDVQVIRTTSSIAVMGLLSGEMAILQVAAPTVISANLRGSDAVYVAAGVVTLDYWLMSGKNIKNGAQLKNGIIGSSDLSGASFIASQFAARKVGLDPNKEIAIIRSGGTPERLVALRHWTNTGHIAEPADQFYCPERGL